MESSAVSVDATPWLLLIVVAILLLASRGYARCRVCGSGRRVLRVGRHGPFLGCSNYPRCHAGTTTSGHRFPVATRGRGPLPPLPRRRGVGLLPQGIGALLVVLVLILLSQH